MKDEMDVRFMLYFVHTRREEEAAEGEGEENYTRAVISRKNKPLIHSVQRKDETGREEQGPSVICLSLWRGRGSNYKQQLTLTQWQPEY